MGRLISVKINSRFSSQVIHNTLVKYSPESIPQPILDWYCACKSGSRVFVACAHQIIFIEKNKLIEDMFSKKVPESTKQILFLNSRTNFINFSTKRDLKNNFKKKNY
ncbi:hypothetical protein BpHYR1_030126 [Brachionus plicatilis]|uniref:SWIM-type domain-containing protein n=1 Tax=Brachionus plicatilis TaxID=10195 RepID=A0A3M7RLU9_BRAPC|nr:hypothetical protein BpHYR1_030126 [Brachionus plicatilis]